MCDYLKLKLLGSIICLLYYAMGLRGDQTFTSLNGIKYFDVVSCVAFTMLFKGGGGGGGGVIIILLACD